MTCDFPNTHAQAWWHRTPPPLLPRTVTDALAGCAHALSSPARSQINVHAVLSVPCPATQGFFFFLTLSLPSSFLLIVPTFSLLASMFFSSFPLRQLYSQRQCIWRKGWRILPYVRGKGVSIKGVNNLEVFQIGRLSSSDTKRNHCPSLQGLSLWLRCVSPCGCTPPPGETVLGYHFGSLFSLTVLAPPQPVMDSKHRESGGDIPTVRQVPGAQQKPSKYFSQWAGLVLWPWCANAASVDL